MKKIYLNENSFKLMMKRMDDKMTFEESRVLTKKLLVEGATKLKNIERGFLKSWDEFAGVLTKAQLSSVRKSYKSFDDGFFKKINNFDPQVAKPFTFLSSSNRLFKSWMKNVDDAIEVAAKKAGEAEYLTAARKVDGLPPKGLDVNTFKKYKNLIKNQKELIKNFNIFEDTLNSLKNIDELKDAGKNVDDAIIEALSAGGKNDLLGMSNKLDNLNKLDGPLGDVWTGLKNSDNSGLAKTTDVDIRLDLIKNKFFKYGFNPRVFKQVDVKGVKEIISSKGLTDKNSFVITFKNPKTGKPDMAIINVKDPKNLNAAKESLEQYLKKNDGAISSLVDAMVKIEKLLMKILKNVRIPVRVRIISLTSLGAYAGYAISTATIYCTKKEEIQVWSDDVGEYLVKKYGDNTGWDFFVCLSGNAAKNIVSPIWGIAKIFMNQYKRVIDGLNKEMVLAIKAKCKELQNQKVGAKVENVDVENIDIKYECDCKKISVEIAKEKTETIQNFVDDIQSTMNNITNESVKKEALNELKKAVEAAEIDSGASGLSEFFLPNVMFNNTSGDVEVNIPHIVEGLCMSLQSGYVVANLQRILNKWQSFFGRSEGSVSSGDPSIFCNVGKVKSMYKDILYLQKWAEKGYLRTDSEASKWDGTQGIWLFPMSELVVTPTEADVDTGLQYITMWIEATQNWYTQLMTPARDGNGTEIAPTSIPMCNLILDNEPGSGVKEEPALVFSTMLTLITEDHPKIWKDMLLDCDSELWMGVKSGDQKKIKMVKNQMLTALKTKVKIDGKKVEQLDMLGTDDNLFIEFYNHWFRENSMKC